MTQNVSADDLEIISIGCLHKGTWDKKYWSSSRGKDRYPYPIGYRAVRNHNGVSYEIEVCEGRKGPSFVISSTDGESCSGQTPDMAWDTFQKKTAPRSKLGHGKRFSCKIDGVEFFGFKNAIVQRMLRELISNVNGAADQNLLSPSSCNESGRSEPDIQSPESCKHPKVPPSSAKSKNTRKRSRKVKVAAIDSSSGPELKKLQQDVPDSAAFCNIRKEDQNYNDEKYFTSISKEDCKVDENTKYFSSTMEKNKVLDRENTSLLVKDVSPLEPQRFANPSKMDVNHLQAQKAVSSEDSKFTSPAINLSKQKEQVRMSKQYFSSGDTEGCNSLEEIKDDIGEMSLTESKIVASLDLCAPDSLELIQDNTSDHAPECNTASPCKVECELDASGPVPPEEMARSLEGEEEVGTYVSNGCSEKNSDDSVGQELANSMMALLLPQAFPLLKKTSRRKRAKSHTSEICFTSGDTCLNSVAMKSSKENDGMRHTMNTLSPGKHEVEMLVEGFPRDMEGKLHSSTTLHLDTQSMDNLKCIVPDTFEDERSQCADYVEADEAFCSRYDRNPDNVRLLESSFVQKTKSNVHTGVRESDSVDDRVPVVVSDNLKKVEPLRSDSRVSCMPANMQIHLKQKSENVFTNSDKNSICGETPTVDKLMGEESRPIKDVPDSESIFVAPNRFQLAHGDSTSNCVIHDQVDILSRKGAAHSADKVALSSDTAYAKKVLPPHPTKNSDNLNAVSSNNKLVPYRRRLRSAEKRFQNSSNHGNQYTTSAGQASATKDVSDVNPIVSVSPLYMSDIEVDAIETMDTINNNTPAPRWSSDLHPTKKFRTPFTESIIYRNTRDDRVPELETSVATEFAQFGSSGDSLSRNVSSGSEIKLDGTYKNLSTEFDIVRSDKMVCEAQEVVDHAAKSRDTRDGKRYQDDAKVEEKDCSSLFQDREKNLFLDRSVHDTEDNMVKVNVHPQYEYASGGGHDNRTHIELHKECLLLNQVSSFDTNINRACEDIFKLVSCYVQPAPVLSVVLSVQGDDIHISVLCGILADRHRTIFIYKVSLQEPRRGYPVFLGYTSLMLPNSKYTLSGEIAFERLPLHFTPDGQWLVFSNSFKAPYCRKQSIHCMCSLCRTNGFEENAIKLIHVKQGYVSLVAKLKTEYTVQSVLVCEPTHLVALEKNGRMQVWVMNSQWSDRAEENILPSLHHISPCIVELKKIPKHPSLIIGHNGCGDFGLWDISKRTILSRFSAPRNSIFQFLPIGLFSWKREPARANLNVEEQIKGIISSTERLFSGISENSDFLSDNREDVAVWLLVSSLCNSEVENDNEANGSWRLALLIDNMVILGSCLDPRACVVDALGGCGIIATNDGLVYSWELSTGLKLADLHHFKSGRVSCIASDPKSGVLAVAGDENQLLVYAKRSQQLNGLLI